MRLEVDGYDARLRPLMTYFFNSFPPLGIRINSLLAFHGRHPRSPHGVFISIDPLAVFFSGVMVVVVYWDSAFSRLLNSLISTYDLDWLFSHVGDTACAVHVITTRKRPRDSKSPSFDPRVTQR